MFNQKLIKTEYRKVDGKPVLVETFEKVTPVDYDAQILIHQKAITILTAKKAEVDELSKSLPEQPK